MRDWQLCSRHFAWQQAHFPENQLLLDQAKRRLAFENLLLYQTALFALGSRGKRGLRFDAKEGT